MTQERWTTRHDGRTHEVSVDSRHGSLGAEWRVDGELVAQGREREKKLVLVPDDAHDPVLGAVAVQAPLWFGVTRRVVLLPGEAVGMLDDDEDDLEDSDDAEDGEDDSPEVDLRTEARLHLLLTLNQGTVDLDPEPDSRAAARLDRIARHPRLHVVWSALTGGGWIACLFLFGLIIEVLEPYLPQGPDIQGPNLSQYLPDWDLPSVPFPDLPSIPFPDLPDLPDWVGIALKLLVAVTIATVAARGEAKRWRKRHSPETVEDDADVHADAEAEGRPELTGS